MYRLRLTGSEMNSYRNEFLKPTLFIVSQFISEIMFLKYDYLFTTVRC